SPDGKVILTESRVEKSGPPRLNSENDCGRSIRLWDAATGRPLEPPLLENVNPLYDVRFSPDGKCLWACFGENRSGILQRWDVASGQRSGDPIEHSGQITVLDLSPDGKALLTAWGKRDGPGKVRLWDAATGQPLCDPLPHPGKVSAAAFSPDGKLVATACNGVRLWTVPGGELMHFPLQDDGRISHLAFSRDGRTLACASEVRKEVTL